MRSASKQSRVSGVLLLVGLVALSWSSVQAGQGCPFDDGSCQEYCSQQGCSMGYCGHFAWIQCICRKCGDEWSWYDKVRYNPDKTVNQTELDSLKLNGTAPIILTNSSANSDGQQQHVDAPPVAVAPQAPVASSTATVGAKQQQQATPKKQATLTTLLIPDLSDSNKLDLNDIPDENSDKFLDYLAKNHERLAQATSASKTGDEGDEAEEETGGDEDSDETTASASAPSTTSNDNNNAVTTAPTDDETIEIQISTSNNNTTNSGRAAVEQQQPQPQSLATEQLANQAESAVKRLLRMAVIERNKDEIA